MCYNIISLYFGQKSLYYFALYCFVSLSPTLISWLHICSFLQSLGPTRQPCAFTWELNLLIWIIVTVSLLQKVLNKHSKNHEYLGFSDAGIVEANNVAMLVFWSTPLICSIAGCHWYTSLGEDRDAEDTRDDSPPAPSGGDNWEEGTTDHAGMSCVSGPDQTSITGRTNIYRP